MVCPINIPRPSIGRKKALGGEAAFAELVPIAKRAYHVTPAERPTTSMEDVGKVKLLCDVFFIKMSRAAVQARAADEAGQDDTP